MTRRRKTGVLLAVSLLSTFAVIFGCAKPNALPPESPAPATSTSTSATARSNEPVWKVEVRAEETGEFQRRHKIDPDGREREVHIDLVDKSTIVQSLSEAGEVTALTWNNLAGNNKVSASLEKGKVIEATIVDAKGNVTFHTDQEAVNALILSVSGKPEFSLNTQNKAPIKSTFILFSDDGKTPKIKLSAVDQIRQKLEIYNEDGTLKYEEELATTEIKADQPLNYQGSLYLNGKLAYKISLQEGPSHNWISSLSKIEKVAEDGSIAQTWTFDKNRGTREEREELDRLIEPLKEQGVYSEVEYILMAPVSIKELLIEFSLQVNGVMEALNSHSGK